MIGTGWKLLPPKWWRTIEAATVTLRDAVPQPY
jgi:hypothetical protein